MTLYVLGLTGFTSIYWRFMNNHHRFLHVGDGESRFANSAGLADFFMHLLSVFSDIVNTFFTQTSHLFEGLLHAHNF